MVIISIANLCFGGFKSYWWYQNNINPRRGKCLLKRNEGSWQKEFEFQTHLGPRPLWNFCGHLVSSPHVCYLQTGHRCLCSWTCRCVWAGVGALAHLLTALLFVPSNSWLLFDSQLILYWTHLLWWQLNTCLWHTSKEEFHNASHKCLTFLKRCSPLSSLRF